MFEELVKKFFSSRKAVVMLVAVVGVIILASLDKVDSNDAWKFLTLTVPTWLAGQSFVDGIASSKKDAGPKGASKEIDGGKDEDASKDSGSDASSD